MPDYGHDIAFGVFLTPDSADPRRVVQLAQHADDVGLELVTFQDHPYLPGFLDTWTLLSYVAASTTRIRIAPCVINLPLRPPAVLARAAASLDRLSDGRLDLGLGAGAGAFVDDIAGMGGPRRSAGESVSALAEAIRVVRALWDTTQDEVHVAGEHYHLRRVRPGPAPRHAVEIWLGSYRRRMLRLTGAAADGWYPSSDYLPPDRIGPANAVIDAAATEAGRSPASIRRLYNISGRLNSGDGFLQGSAERWVDDLTSLAVEQGMSTFVLGTDSATMINHFAHEVAPAVRRRVAAIRSAA